MLTIVFSANPERVGRINNHRYRIGSMRFESKRQAAIWLADSGRRATAWIMEVQELHRLAVYSGQAHAATMELMELANWARLKADFDQRYLTLRRNARHWEPAEMWPRLKGITNTVAEMADVVKDMGGHSDRIQARIIQQRCQQIIAELTAWADPSQATA